MSFVLFLIGLISSYAYADGAVQSFANCSNQRFYEASSERNRPGAYFGDNGQLRFWEDQTGFQFHTRELDGVQRVLDVSWPLGRVRYDYQTNANGMPTQIRIRQNAGGGGPWMMDTLVRYSYDTSGNCTEDQIIKFTQQNQGITVYDRKICETIRPFLNGMTTSEFANCTASLNGITQALWQRAQALDYPFGAEGVAGSHPVFNTLYGFDDLREFTAVASVISSCRGRLPGAVGADGAGGTRPTGEAR